MKKIFKTILLITLSCLLMCACSNNNTSNTETTNTTVLIAISPDYPPYESLQKIEPQNLIEISKIINQNISEDTNPIPSRIESINLLRSIHKYQSTFFFELFGALKSKFLKTCLHYDKNPRLQNISLNFIREIFDDDSYEISNDTVYDLYYDLLQFLESNDENLKQMAKVAIKTMAEKVTRDAKIIVLIETLKNADDNLCAFVFECFKNAIENLRGLIYLNYNFNDIFDRIGIEEITDKDLYSSIEVINQYLNYYFEPSDYNGSKPMKFLEDLNNLIGGIL